jgi:hypothetical protein
MAGCEMENPALSSETLISLRHKRSKTARRVGSAKVRKTSASIMSKI